VRTSGNEIADIGGFADFKDTEDDVVGSWEIF
jgi:hypothetical protein